MLLRLFLGVLLLLPQLASALSLPEIERVGQRVWQSESGGTRDGLTAWNEGEGFASLGIGHFIWYPAGVNGPFEESFPKLVDFLRTNGVEVPVWLDGDCPWNSIVEFQREFRSARTNRLRDLLASTISLQSRFLVKRMNDALPKILKAAPQGERGHVKTQFERLAATSSGTYALIDYVNFKGEGTNPSERYKGEGWGLLHVLSAMRSDAPDATAEFIRVATALLERRVQNAPPERHEERWLPGWKNRVRAYAP